MALDDPAYLGLSPVERGYHPYMLIALLQPAVAAEKSFQSLEIGWHNELIDFIQHELPKLIFILILAFVIQRLIELFVRRLRKLADRHAVRDPGRAAQLRTVASILRATAFAVIGFIVLLHILSVFNINLTPLLASAGVVGVGIGLGAQSLFKDMLNGIFILVENQYNVGETISAASLTGVVENLTLRCTTLRNADGTLYIIPNSQIATVANLSRDFAVGTLNLDVDASANPDKVLSILRQIAKDVSDSPDFKAAILNTPAVPGVDKLKGRVATYPITMRLQISQKDNVLRELRLRIIKAFEQEGIPLGTDAANLLVIRHEDPTAPPAPQAPLPSA